MAASADPVSSVMSVSELNRQSLDSLVSTTPDYFRGKSVFLSCVDPPSSWLFCWLVRNFVPLGLASLMTLYTASGSDDALALVDHWDVPPVVAQSPHDLRAIIIRRAKGDQGLVGAVSTSVLDSLSESTLESLRSSADFVMMQRQASMSNSPRWGR